LLDQAFGLARRTKTSYRLREGSQAAPGLSQVIRDTEIGIAAAISYWPVVIGATPALLLGPLAVNARRKNQGFGLALMQGTLEMAKALGHKLVILVGDEPYYARVGFRRIPGEAILMPGPLNRARFLYLELEDGAMAGVGGMVLPPHRR
jgi:predicted N-acetyltransferase YhbS